MAGSKIIVVGRWMERQPSKQESDLARRMAESAEAIERDIKLLQQVQERI